MSAAAHPPPTTPGPAGPGPLPAFEPVATRRPVRLAQPGTDLVGAPYAAVEADVADPDATTVVGLRAGGVEVRAHRADGRVWIELDRDGRTTRHESRRRGRAPRPTALALALTGTLVTAFTLDGDRWLARALLWLDERRHPGLGGPDPHDEAWLAGLVPVGDVARVGRFGQLGLRDPRLVTEPDGTPVVDDDGALLLTLTAAGPAGFGTGHAAVWSLHPGTLALRHRSDLFFRRPDRPGVYGDHACHLVRDDDAWLLATSTWGDFDVDLGPRVDVTLARTDADLLRGAHVLDTEPLALPTTGLTSVGVWDPHLVRGDDGWLVAYVSATAFFSFHPVLAEGPDLGDLRLRAAAAGRTACEAPTLLRLDDGWRVLASHGRDGSRDADGRAATYPVLDLDLREVGLLEARYPTNLPWPTLAPPSSAGGDWLLVGFDGSPAGGPLLGYGTHGDLVLQRPVRTGT